HILTFFIENTLLLEMLSLFGLAIILFGLLSTPLTKFKLPLFILFISIMILLFSDTYIIIGLISCMMQILNVILLLVVIVLFISVLQEYLYIEYLMGVFHDFINTSKKFYFTLVSLTQVLTYFLLFGSITMMYQFVDVVLKNQKGEMSERYKGTALL